MNKRLITGIVAVIAAAALSISAYFVFRPKKDKSKGATDADAEVYTGGDTGGEKTTDAEVYTGGDTDSGVPAGPYYGLKTASLDPSVSIMSVPSSSGSSFGTPANAFIGYIDTDSYDSAASTNFIQLLQPVDKDGYALPKQFSYVQKIHTVITSTTSTLPSLPKVRPIPPKTTIASGRGPSGKGFINSDFE